MFIKLYLLCFITTYQEDDAFMQTNEVDNILVDV